MNVLTTNLEGGCHYGSLVTIPAENKSGPRPTPMVVLARYSANVERTASASRQDLTDAELVIFKKLLMPILPVVERVRIANVLLRSKHR